MINVSDLARCFPQGGDVGPEALVGAGLMARGRAGSSRSSGDGELTGHALTVRAHAFSKTATAKIAAAGGRAEVLPA